MTVYEQFLSDMEIPTIPGSESSKTQEKDEVNIWKVE